MEMEKLSVEEEKVNQLKNRAKINALTDLLTNIIILFLKSIFGAIVGYLLSKYIKCNEIKGIVLGIFCPWGFIFVDKITKFIYEKFGDLYDLICLITVGIYAVIWFCIKLYISCYIGIIAMPILIIYYIIKIYYACKNNYTEEVQTIYKNYAKQNDNDKNQVVINTENNYKSDNQYKIEFYCERCDKRISEETYDLYGGLCEECYTDLYIDNNYF